MFRKKNQRDEFSDQLGFSRDTYPWYIRFDMFLDDCVRFVDNGGLQYIFGSFPAKLAYAFIGVGVYLWVMYDLSFTLNTILVFLLAYICITSGWQHGATVGEKSGYAEGFKDGLKKGQGGED